MIRCSFGSKVVLVGPEDLYTPLHIEKTAREIARQAALLSLEIAEENPTPLFPYFKQLLEDGGFSKITEELFEKELK